MIPAAEIQWHSLFRIRRISFILTASMILFLISTSCSNNEQQAKKENTIEDDSLQTVKSIVSEDSVMVFRNDAGNWIGESIQKTGLDWNRFHLTEFWSDDSLQEKSFEPSQEFYKDYAQVLRWSPDSTYVLDIGSYGSVKVKDKNGKTQIESGEPDTEVSMIYPKTKSKTRLLFFGPGTVIVDGRWLDNSQVAVLGMYDEKGNHHPDTLLWIINAKNKFFRKYEWE
ncbi:MAG TPA: hypothetical protein VH396_13890 [Chitinophagaceae bacterium]|jgi:hypothetical protein